MRIAFAAAAVAVAISCAPTAVLAQERLGSAALGALSGAVVLGPVGAVAGAAIGYMAGPAIANSWGVRRSAPSSLTRMSRRSATPASDTMAGDVKPQSTPASAPKQSVPERAQVAEAGHGSAANVESHSASAVSAPPVQGLE
jgi:hypothetical protein